MADKTQLEISIRPDGQVRIHTHGLKGQACLTETKDLENALGKVTRREKTSEFYATEARSTSKLRSR